MWLQQLDGAGERGGGEAKEVGEVVRPYRPSCKPRPLLPGYHEPLNGSSGDGGTSFVLFSIVIPIP